MLAVNAIPISVSEESRVLRSNQNKASATKIAQAIAIGSGAMPAKTAIAMPASDACAIPSPNSAIPRSVTNTPRLASIGAISTLAITARWRNGNCRRS